MKLKHYFWMLSKSVKYVMTWLFSNVYYPIKALEPNIWNIHVNTSMIDNQSKTNKIWSYLSWEWKFSISNSLLYSSEFTWRNIVFDVIIVNFKDLKSGLFSVFNDIKSTKLICCWSIVDTLIPKHPNLLGEGLPLFICFCDYRFLLVWLYVFIFSQE